MNKEKQGQLPTPAPGAVERTQTCMHTTQTPRKNNESWNVAA